jgi:hypothetical protein
MWQISLMELADKSIIAVMQQAVEEGVMPPCTAALPSLVLWSSEAVAISSGVKVTRLDNEEVKVVTSFSTTCRLLLAKKVGTVVIVETPELALDEFEVDVIRRLSVNVPVIRVRVTDHHSRPSTGRKAPSRVSHSALDKGLWMPGQQERRRIGRLVVEQHSPFFSVDGQLTPISCKESEVLWALASAPEQIVPGVELRKLFQNLHPSGASSALRQYIFRLRRKLIQAENPAVIVSKRKSYALISSAEDLNTTALPEDRVGQAEGQPADPT